MKNIRRCTGLLMLIVGMFALGANVAIGEGLKTRALTGDNVFLHGPLVTVDGYRLTAGEDTSFELSIYADANVKPYTGSGVFRIFGYNVERNNDSTNAVTAGEAIGSLNYSGDNYTITFSGTPGNYTYLYLKDGDLLPTENIPLEFIGGELDNPISFNLTVAGVNSALEFELVADGVTYSHSAFTQNGLDPDPLGTIEVVSAEFNRLEINDQPSGVPAIAGGGVFTSQPSLVAIDIYGNIANNREMTCVATAGDVAQGFWYTGGNSVNTTTGIFNFSNLSALNLGEADVAPTSVLFSVEKINGESVGIVSATIAGVIPAYVVQPGQAVVMDGSWLETTTPIGWSEDEFTIEFWHKSTTNVADNALFSCSSATSNVEILQTANEGELRVIVNDTLSTAQVDGLIPEAYTALGEWNYFALVFNGQAGNTSTAVGVSVNGEAFTYFSFGRPKVAAPTSLYFGRRAVDNNSYFNGELDYIKLWSKALDISEIRENNVLSITDPSSFDNLIGLYYFDGLNAFNEINDYSTKSNNLQVNNINTNSFVTSYAQGSSTILEIKDISTDSCVVVWENPVTTTTVTDFSTRIEYSKNQDFSGLVSSTPEYNSSVTSIAVLSLDANETYYFRLVSAYDQNNKVENRLSEVMSATTYPNGATGSINGLEFNGQVGALEFTNPLPLTGEWAVQSWIKLNDSTEQTFLEDDNQKVIVLNSLMNDGNLLIKTAALNSINSGIKLEENQWINITITYDSVEQLTVYVNGLAKFTTNISFQPTFSRIGSSTLTTSMTVDEFSVWNRALDSEEIKEAMFNRLDVNAEQLVAYSFNLPSLTTVDDVSGTGNGATFNPGVATYITSTAWEKPVSFKAENLNFDQGKYSFDAVWYGNEDGYLPGDGAYSIRYGTALDSFGEIVSPQLLQLPIVETQENRRVYNIGNIAESSVIYYFQTSYKGSTNWSNVETGYTPLETPGTALRLKDNQQAQIEIPKSESLKGENLTNFTLETWVMLEQSSGTPTPGFQNLKGIIGSKSESTVQSAPVLGVTGDNDKDLYFGFSKDYGEDFFFTVPNVLDYLQWTHLAVTYNGTDMKLYKDGVLLETQTGIYSSPAASAYIGYIGSLNGSVGTRNVGATTGFNGQIDKVRVWNYARSENEIEENFLNPTTGREVGLVLDYRFSGDSNQEISEVYDFSLMNNHGEYVGDVLTNQPWKLSLATIKPEKLLITNEKDDQFDVEPQDLNFQYLLYVSKDDDFTTMIPGYDGIEISEKTTVLTGEKGVFYVKVTAFSNRVDADSGITNGHIRSLSSDTESAITGRLPSPGNCIAFRGNNNIVKLDQTGSLFLEPKSEFTIETWVKMNHNVDQGPHVCLISNKSSQSSNNQGFWFNVKDSSGQLLFGYNDKFHGNVVATGSKNIRDGQWHHAAVTFTTEQVNIYVDGLLDGTVTLSGEFSAVSISNTNKLTIGSSSAATTSLIGFMDEVRIWDVARTKSQILETMNSEIDYRNVPEELVLYYSFDEEVGDVAKDLSANSNDGTLEEFRAVDIDDDATNDSVFVPAHFRSGAMGTIILEDITEFTSSSVKLNWIPQTTQTVKSYTVEVATDKEFTDIVKSVDLGANQVDLFVNELVSKQVYYCRIRAIVDNNGVDRLIRSEDIQTFTTYDGIAAGTALQFDGVNDRIEITPNALNIPTENFAVDMWVYIDPVQNAGYNPLFHTLTNGGLDRKDNLSFGLYVTSNEIYGYAHYKGNGDVKNTLTHFTPTGQITNGEWVHFAVSWGRGDMDTSIFVNGIESRSASGNAVAYTYDTVYVGGIPSDYNGYLNDTLAINPATNFFKGIIDEFRIWNASISALDAQNLYARKLTLDQMPNTVACYFDFNQGSGEVVPSYFGGNSTAVLFDGDTVANSDNSNGPTYVDSGAFNKVPYLKPASDLVIDGFTINWEPVEGASTYTVNVYDLDDNPVGTVTVTAPDTSAIITGLDYGEFTYEVTVSYTDGRPDSTSETVKVSTALPVPGYALQANHADNANQNGYFEVNKHIFTSSPKEFSVEFWAKPTKLRNYNWEIAVMNDNTKNYSTWDSFTFQGAHNGWAYVGTHTGTGRIEAANAFEYADTTTAPGNITYELSIPMWQHFAFTYDNGDAVLYRNGEVIGTRSGMNYEQSGVWAKLRFSQIDGRLDQFRIWSKALSELEIKTNSTINLAPGTEDLRACYRFDQFSALPDGTVPVHDYSGNGLHGLIYNAADVTPESMAKTVPSYAVVKPVILPAKFVDINEETNYGKIEIAWKASDISAVIDKVEQQAPFEYDLTHESKYLVIVNSSKDFSRDSEIGRYEVYYDETVPGDDSFRVENGIFYYTPETEQLMSEPYYVRITSANNLENVSADNPDLPYPDEPVAEYGNSRYSEIFTLSAPLEAPGNCMYNDSVWPSFVNVSNSPVVGLSEVSLECWLQPASVDGSVVVLSSKRFSSVTPGYNVYLEDGIVKLELADGTINEVYNSGAYISDGHWHHVALTIGDGSVQIYVDGNEVLSQAINIGSFSSSLGQLTMLQDVDETMANVYSGSIDEVKAWSRKISETEINDNLLTSTDFSSTGLIAYYNCDQSGTDSTMYDVVGFNDGDVIGNRYANWNQSHAMGAPLATSPTSIEAAEFVVNFEHPVSGDLVDSYEIVVADNPQLSKDSGAVANITGLPNSTTFATVDVLYDDNNDPVAIAPGGAYFYKVIAHYNIDGGISRESNTEALSTLIPNIEPGNALTFEHPSKRSIQVPFTNQFHSPEVTITSWVKFSEWSGQGPAWGTIVTLGDYTDTSDGSGDTSYTLLFKNDDMRTFQIRGSGQDNFTYAVEANRWYCISVAFGSNSSKLYIDGQLIASDIKRINSNHSEELYIGSSGGNEAYLNGSVDEVRIWSYERTPAQINADMNYSLKGDEEGLIAYYKMDNNFTEFLPDMSQNGNDGEVYVQGSGTEYTTSNGWVDSYAMGCPQGLPAVEIDYISFTGRFSAPTTVSPVPEYYVFEVTRSPSFNIALVDSTRRPTGTGPIYEVPVDNIISIAETTEELLPSTPYYYRAFHMLPPKNGVGESVKRRSEPIEVTTRMVAPGYAADLQKQYEQYIDIERIASLKGSELPELTISLWVKPIREDDNGNLENNNGTLTGIIGGNRITGINYTDDAGTAYTEDENPFVGIENTDLILSYVSVASELERVVVGNVFQQKRWYHIAMTVGSGEMIAYVDGVEAARRTVSGMLRNDKYIEFIGQAFNGANVTYDGLIDELRVWNVARSQSQIRELMYTQLEDIPSYVDIEGPGRGLVLYHQFNQLSGDVVFDGLPTPSEATVINRNDDAVVWVVNEDDDQPAFPGANLFALYKKRSVKLVYNIGLFEFDGITFPETIERPNANGFDIVNFDDPNNYRYSNDDFAVYGTVLPYSTDFENDVSYYTTNWGLDSPLIESVQVTKQAMYVRQNFQDVVNFENVNNQAMYDLAFDLRLISPAVYGLQATRSTFPDDDTIDAMKERFANSTAEEYQLLWRQEAVVSAGDVYVDVAIQYADENLFVAVPTLVKDEFGRLDGALVPITIDGAEPLQENDPAYYTVRFSRVPATISLGGILYEDGVFALGSTIPMDEMLLTPVVGIEIQSKVVGDKVEISWTVEDESGVKEYLIERLNPDGTWSVVKVVKVGDKYFYVGEAGVEYRITVVDKYGVKQSYNTDSSEQTWFITLDEGWNLLSLPCEDANISELKKYVDSIWTWNGSGYELTNKAPEAQEGFWVYNPGQERVVEVSGNAPSETTVKLDQGWNLTGPAQNCYAPVNASSIYSWSSDKYNTVLQETGIMMMTRGYWMFTMEQDAEVALP